MCTRVRFHRSYLLTLVGLAVLVAGACAPFVADQQSARVLGPGEAEVTPSFSSVSFSVDGETEHIQNHLGIRAGYGVSDGVEVRGTFERVSVEGADEGLTLIGAGIKWAVAPDQVAFYLPLGFVTGGGIDTGETWTFVPTLLATFRPSPNVELTPSVKGIYPFASEDPELFLGFHLGAGISQDLDVWAIRPEFGAVVNPGESGVTWGWSLGLSLRP